VAARPGEKGVKLRTGGPVGTSRQEKGPRKRILPLEHLALAPPGSSTARSGAFSWQLLPPCGLPEPPHPSLELAAVDDPGHEHAGPGYRPLCGPQPGELPPGEVPKDDPPVVHPEPLPGRTPLEGADVEIGRRGRGRERSDGPDEPVPFRAGADPPEVPPGPGRELDGAAGGGYRRSSARMSASASLSDRPRLPSARSRSARAMSRTNSGAFTST